MAPSVSTNVPICGCGRLSVNQRTSRRCLPTCSYPDAPLQAGELQDYDAPASNRSVTIHSCARCGRGGGPAGGCDELAKLHAFLNADDPELVARRAVRFDRISAVEQSHQIGERIPLLLLFALAVRAGGGEIDGLTHASKSMPWARPELSEPHGCTRRCRSDVATDRRPPDAKWSGTPRTGARG